MANNINETMRKFGFPDTIVAETDRWAVLLRPQQATLGALVLACREPVKALSEVSPEAFAELHGLVARAERMLKAEFAYDKINYLCLMMVDPDVHFHVLPRYAGERQFDGMSFADPGWPGVPNLGHAPTLQPATRQALLDALRRRWAEAG